MTRPLATAPRTGIADRASRRVIPPCHLRGGRIAALISNIRDDELRVGGEGDFDSRNARDDGRDRVTILG